ncbi:unnamed protein product [Peniophora sp. CBMAI 1063]|nr:unnamed protein product [Peniophora sp. CBMAI 1063]
MPPIPQPPVYKLPPELLVHIFEFLIPDDSSHWSYTAETCLDDPRALSQVCSHWRAISLDIKSLWTTVPIRNELWARLSLERSRPLPLEVPIWLEGDDLQVAARKSSFYFYDIHDALQAAFSESHRIRVLRIEISALDYGILDWLGRKLFTFLTSSEIPTLEHLDVDLKWYGAARTYPSFLGQQTPNNLRHLSLCDVDQDYLPCPHLFVAPLTALELGSGQIWESVEDALEALSRIPTLEILRIRRAGDGDEERLSAIPEFNIFELALGARSVSLPKLKTLDLYETMELIACLMKYLAIPTSAHIRLQAMQNPEDEGFVLDFVNIIASALSSHHESVMKEGRPFRGLYMDMTTWKDERRFVIAADHSLRDQDLPASRRACLIPSLDMHEIFSPQELPLSLSLCDDDTSATRMELMTIFANLPLFKNVCALTLTEHHDDSQDSEDIFESMAPAELGSIMPPLSGITVAHFYGYTAIHALGAFADGALGDTTYLSLVVDITIEEVSFIPPSAESKTVYIPFDELLLALRERTRGRGPRRTATLECLELKSCDIDDAQVAHLRREFGGMQLVWDGLIRGTQESQQRAMWDSINMSAEWDDLEKS